MSTYETIFICSADLPQEKVDAVLEKVKAVITRADGTVNSAELWGRKKLAYPIKRNREGFYVYIVFTSPPGVPALLNQHYRVTDTILRGLTVKVDERYLDKMKSPVKSTVSDTPVPAETPVVPSPAVQAVPSELSGEPKLG